MSLAVEAPIPASTASATQLWRWSVEVLAKTSMTDASPEVVLAHKPVSCASASATARETRSRQRSVATGRLPCNSPRVVATASRHSDAALPWDVKAPPRASKVLVNAEEHSSDDARWLAEALPSNPKRPRRLSVADPASAVHRSITTFACVAWSLAASAADWRRSVWEDKGVLTSAATCSSWRARAVSAAAEHVLTVVAASDAEATNSLEPEATPLRSSATDVCACCNELCVCSMTSHAFSNPAVFASSCAWYSSARLKCFASARWASSISCCK
mmetsp:Transcript_71446/g.198328  ORF Transcript_71446/g.198328 Transcript_71446/m.198328 type:complete len:274 (-) Transcript_71446:1292-2113(-)